MTKKIIIRLSNSIGNQMFMYSAAYAMAKKLNAQLFVDDETAFKNKENLYTYGLDTFNFTASAGLTFADNGHVTWQPFPKLQNEVYNWSVMDGFL